MPSKTLFSVVTYDEQLEFAEITLNNLRKIYWNHADICTFARCHVDSPCHVTIPENAYQYSVNAHNDISYAIKASAELAIDNDKDWVIFICGDYIPIHSKLFYMTKTFSDYDVICEPDTRYKDGCHAGYFAFKPHVFSYGVTPFAMENDGSNGDWEMSFGAHVRSFKAKTLPERNFHGKSSTPEENATTYQNKFGLFPLGFVHIHSIKTAKQWKI